MYLFVRAVPRPVLAPPVACISPTWDSHLLLADMFRFPLFCWELPFSTLLVKARFYWIFWLTVHGNPLRDAAASAYCLR